MDRRIISFITVALFLVGLIDLLAWPGMSHLAEVYLPEFTGWFALLFWGWSGISAVVLASAYFSKADPHDPSSPKRLFSAFGWMIMHVIPRLIFTVISLLYFISEAVISWADGQHDPLYLLWAAAGIWAFLTIAIIDGMVRGRFAFKVFRRELTFDRLPRAFDGLKVVQISDLHIGSFFNRHGPVKQAVEMINRLEADLIVFTGDLVNNVASEAEGWGPIFAPMQAKLGKYSILGNHDYGEYVKWPSKEALAQNMRDLEEQHQRFEFDLLNNRSQVFEKDGQKIYLAGVENWGLPPFPQHGDLKASLEGIPADAFTILLSHDPSHWDAQVIPESEVDLTLSGHTHGMQFGIEIGKWRWSPVKFKYPRWADLYQVGKQFLYVNRGFGHIGFLGRVGIRPEISLLTLRSGQ